jgi:hypothetical protein
VGAGEVVRDGGEGGNDGPVAVVSAGSGE